MFIKAARCLSAPRLWEQVCCFLRCQRLQEPFGHRRDFGEAGFNDLRGRNGVEAGGRAQADGC